MRGEEAKDDDDDSHEGGGEMRWKAETAKEDGRFRGEKEASQQLQRLQRKHELRRGEKRKSRGSTKFLTFWHSNIHSTTSLSLYLYASRNNCIRRKLSHYSLPTLAEWKLPTTVFYCWLQKLLSFLLTALSFLLPGTKFTTWEERSHLSGQKFWDPEDRNKKSWSRGDFWCVSSCLAGMKEWESVYLLIPSSSRVRCWCICELISQDPQRLSSGKRGK